MRHFYLVTSLLGVLYLPLSGIAHADWCSDSVRQTVEQKTNADHHQDGLTAQGALVALLPPISFTGGFVQTFDVPMLDPMNAVATVYHVLIDESCDVRVQYEKKFCN